MDSIAFVVPAIPIAQPRQRNTAAIIHGRAVARNYTPVKDSVNRYKATVQVALAEAYDGPPIDNAIALWLTFVLPRPQSKRWKRKPMPRYFHSGKPDIDNLIKSTLDALNGLLFIDDSRIAWVNAQKVVAAGDETPHVGIRASGAVDVVNCSAGR